MTKNFLPKIFTFLINFLYLECFLPHSFNPKFFGPKIFLDLNFFGLKISWPRFFLTKKVLDLTFWTKTTTITTTTIEMGFDTIEINLVFYFSDLSFSSPVILAERFVLWLGISAIEYYQKTAQSYFQCPVGVKFSLVHSLAQLSLSLFKMHVTPSFYTLLILLKWRGE